MKLIVGVDDGIILDVKRCVIVDHHALSESERTLLDSGTEEQAIAVAYRHGRSLYEVLDGCGYGQLNYANAVAYSPDAMRDEIMSKVDNLRKSVTDVDESMREELSEMVSLLDWALTLPEEDLFQIGYFILSDESEEVWGQYFANVVLGVAWWRSITESRKSDEDSGD